MILHNLVSNREMGSEAKFKSEDGDLASTERGRVCLDVSLFADESHKYSYTVKPSILQDPSGKF